MAWDESGNIFRVASFPRSWPEPSGSRPPSEVPVMVRRVFALLGVLGGTALAAAYLTGSPDAAPGSAQPGLPASGGRTEWVRQLAGVLTATRPSAVL